MAMIYEMIIAGLGGMLVQMFLKAKSLSDKAHANNEKFHFGKFVLADWLSYAISITGILLAAYILRRRFVGSVDETEVAELILVTCATIGYSGSDLLSRIFGVTSKRLNAMLDIKANIADHVIAKETKSLEDLKERGSVAVGKDVTEPPDYKKNAN